MVGRLRKFSESFWLWKFFEFSFEFIEWLNWLIDWLIDWLILIIHFCMHSMAHTAGSYHSYESSFFLDIVSAQQISSRLQHLENLQQIFTLKTFKILPSLIDLIDWLINWLIGWLIDWLYEWLATWF